MKVTISKPYSTEHACRLNNPDKYDKIRRVNCDQKHDDKCIDVLYGISGDTSEIQALRYDKDEWSVSDARVHCTGRDGTFEAAEKTKKLARVLKPIEDITKSDIEVSSKWDLYHYRSAAQQLYKKWFHNPSRPNCSEQTFLYKYGMVVDSMSSQSIRYDPGDIDAALFALRIEDLDGQEDELVAAAKFVPFVGLKKEDNPERIVYGVVYEPDVKDTQDDWMTEDEIRKAAYSFMENGEVSKVNHIGRAIASQVLETYIAPVDFRIEGQLVTKGSWVLAERVLDDDTWEKIEKGEITGFSMAGEGMRIPNKEPASDR